MEAKLKEENKRCIAFEKLAEYQGELYKATECQLKKAEKDLKNTNETLALMTKCREEETLKLVEAEKKLEKARQWSHRFCLFGSQDNMSELNQILEGGEKK